MRVHFSVVALVLAISSCGPRSGGGEHGDLLRIEVEPANATITYTGAPASLDYRAIGTYEDGTVLELTDATFLLDPDGTKLGAFTEATFAASGQFAGKGGVLAQLDDVVGSTSVMVVVHTTDLGTGVPPDAGNLFPDVAPPGALSQSLVYPLDNAVMPASVRSPNIQWEGGTAGSGDLYRVRIVAGYATADTILADAPGFGLNLQLAIPQWQVLLNSVGAGVMSMSVDHYDPTNGAHGGTPIQIKMISADVTGAIYYWNLNAGRMERIDSMGRAPAIANPPDRPSQPGNRCVACHTVSKNGRYLSGNVWDANAEGAVFDMSSEAVRTGNPAPTLAPLVEGSTYRQLFSTFNADASRLLVNTGTSFALYNPMTGQPVPTAGTPLPTSNVAHPSWSPDGSTIVFINNTNGSWAVDYTSGDLAILSASPGDTFGPTQTLVPVASVDPSYAAPSWPSFAPDSNWIAYGAGTHSRGANGTAENPGSLFVINKAGGVAIRLDNACASARRCYLPNFSPYDAGGYFWLVFYSFKDYGNTRVGTKGSGRRQLWVTAIDKSKLGTGQDPSSVPYWLPDQDVASQNMSAFWALPAPIQ